MMLRIPKEAMGVDTLWYSGTDTTRPVATATANMPTAIVRVITHEGIVLAADGCATDDNGNKTSERECKIYSTEKPGQWIVGYGLSELAPPTFEYHDRESVKLSFAEIGKKVSRILEMQESFKNLVDLSQHFTELFNFEVESTLSALRDRKAISEEDFSAFFHIEKPIRFQFAGYVQDVASVSTTLLTFSKPERGQLDRPTVLMETTFGHFYGSGLILSLLASDEPNFSVFSSQEQIEAAKRIAGKYRIPEFKQFAASLSNARLCAETYIRACSEPDASKIDAACKCICGHIHMAQITPSDGFSWIYECLSP